MLTVARLGGRVYGPGEASFAGRPVVWVGTTKPGAMETKLSWRATDAGVPPPANPAEPAEPPKVWFPGLRSLTLPEHPKLATAVDPTGAGDVTAPEDAEAVAP